MEQKLDLRIQKTYMALTRAFMEMMSEMRFEDIRVSELCERAMVRKSTFYKHFADKYELLAFIVRRTQEELTSRLADEQVGSGIVAYYTKLLTMVFDFLGENSALVESATRSNSFPLILSVLSDLIILDIRDKLRDDAKRGEKLPASPEVMSAFFVGGLMETARCWLQRGKQLGEAELKEQLGTMLRLFYGSASAGAAAD